MFIVLKFHRLGGRTAFKLLLAIDLHLGSEVGGKSSGKLSLLPLEPEPIFFLRMASVHQLECLA